MNMNHKSLLATAVGSVLGLASLAAGAATVTSINITGGTFFMATVTTAPVVFGCDNFDVDCSTNGGTEYVPATGPDTNFVGGYLGNGGAGIPSGTPDPNTIVGFNFFGNPVNVYTAAENLGDDNNGAGSIVGGPVPNGDATGGVLTMDMSSWFANWNGNDFNQGNAAAMGTTSGDCTLGCSYTLSWDSLIVGGAFDGKTGSWVLEGELTTAPAPVPVPAAVWLFGSGLLGLVGVARRRKAA